MHQCVAVFLASGNATDFRTAKTAIVRREWAHELAPRPHKVAHARTWRLRTVGAWGVACLHQGGHATCKLQRRMRGQAHRQTTRHTTRFGALGRIARRRSAPSGVVGFRQRRAGRSNCRFWAFWGPFGAAPTRTDFRTAKNAIVRREWAHELAPRPHKVALARTRRLGTVGAWGVACLHQGGACDM